MKKYPAIVEWTDAWADNDLGRPLGEVLEQPDPVNTSVGFVIESSNRRVVLSGTIEDGGRFMRDCLYIPRKMVRRIRRLRA